MTDLRTVPTPALLLDRGALTRNLDRMRRRMSAHGVALRPHLKTAKCAAVAELATGGKGGITVSTLGEAEYFAGHGFDDLTYAVGITPHKLDRVAGLLRDGLRVRILTDDVEVAAEIARRGAEQGVEHAVLIEIDTGAARGGVRPDDPHLPEIARALSGGAGARVEGVLTHAGHAYECSDTAQIREVAEQERAGVVRAAATLREAGYPCPVVSAGSTPTAVHAADLDGLTEMRPGNYMFFDLYQEGLGCCRREDIAISVLASVVGRSERDGTLLIDAGALALSQDTSASRWSGEAGYGVILDTEGRPGPAGARVEHVHQEHGFVRASAPLRAADWPVGTRVRVLPNHACATAAMHDRYVVLDGGGAPEVWSKARGW